MTEPPDSRAWASRSRRPTGDHEPPPKPKRYWWRFTLGLGDHRRVAAAATATSILLYIGSIATRALAPQRLQDKLDRYLAESTAASRRTSSSSAPTSGPA